MEQVIAVLAFVGALFLLDYVLRGISALMWRFNIVSRDDVEDAAKQSRPVPTDADAQQFVECLRTGREVV